MLCIKSDGLPVSILGSLSDQGVARLFVFPIGTYTDGPSIHSRQIVPKVERAALKL